MSIRSAPVLGYSSLSVRSFSKIRDFEALEKFTMKIPGRVDLLGESYLPTDQLRPLWDEVLDLIENKSIKVLILPSFSHIAGHNSVQVLKFLTLLARKQIRLKTLKEKADSRTHNRDQMMTLAKQSFSKEHKGN